MVLDINHYINQGLRIDWTLPPSIDLKPMGTFIAKTSLTEKAGRIFNNAMFLIVGIQLALYVAKFIPGVKDITTRIENYLSDIPIISALRKLPAMLRMIPALLVARKIAAVWINYQVYPAARTFSEDFGSERAEAIKYFQKIGYAIQSVTLSKSGVDYSAFVFGPKETINNGKWIQVAGGNGWVGEHVFSYLVNMFEKRNILYINGPSVARSLGVPTSYSIGAAQEAGLQLLEDAMKAKQIFLYGTSLGGGAQATAICAHEFKENVKYMAWSDRSFDTLTNAASAMVTSLVKFVFPLLGIELDGVAGARKLNELGITQIVTNNSRAIGFNGILPRDGEIFLQGTDGVIPNAVSLYVGLRKTLDLKLELIKFYGDKFIGHNGDLPAYINRSIQEMISNFFENQGPAT